AQQKAMEKQLLDNMTSITNIDEDAYIMVATNGLLGEKYLKIIPGGGLNYLKRGDQIANTQGTMEIEDLITKFVTGGAGSKSSETQEASADAVTSEATDAEPAFVE
ncbi:MAG TPA: outer membrane lipid asymmetry maintenance protein MlaD, partial [Acinetobacter schindleri]|nr:outer membrane lipid asymmetry maintenance protein MlaD [Acinetobacter schindleri]